MIGSLLTATDNNIKRRKDVYSMAERCGGADVVLSCPGCAGAKKYAMVGGSPISGIANGRRT
jgi:hypothetical protein